MLSEHGLCVFDTLCHRSLSYNVYVNIDDCFAAAGSASTVNDTAISDQCQGGTCARCPEDVRGYIVVLEVKCDPLSSSAVLSSETQQRKFRENISKSCVIKIRKEYRSTRFWLTTVCVPL